jgi:hypothetical protein
MTAALLLAAGSAVLGGALALASQRNRVLLEMTRTFAFAAAAGVVAFHLLPEVLPALGPTALLWIAGGFVLPWLLEVAARSLGPGLLARRGFQGMRVAAEVGFAALIFHSLFEGLALLATLKAHPESADLQIAIIAHHAPLTAAVALPFIELLGVRSTLVRVGLVALAGVFGVLAAKLLPGIASGADPAVLHRATAVVSGALLHVFADEIREQHFASPTERALDILSAAAGLILVGYGASFDLRAVAGARDFGRCVMALALALAPALAASIALEALARRLRVGERLRRSLDGLLATAALLGWVAAAVRFGLGLALAFVPHRSEARPSPSLLDRLSARGPWLLVLLAIAASAEVLAPVGWFEELGPLGMLVVAASLALASQASASGAALLACAMVYRGLAAEMAVPFLALGGLPLRGVPAARALLSAAVGIAGALAVSVVLLRVLPLQGAVAAAAAVLDRASQPVRAQAAEAPLRAACLALVSLLGLAMIWRSGVRGWFAPVRHADPHGHAAHEGLPASAHP